MQEKKQSDETFALACLGVLLLQDVAVVPLLVLLPIIEDTQVLGFDADVQSLALSALSSVAVLGTILLAGRVLLRRVFAAVAGARSSETFVALCLLVVLGTGALTDAAGLSSTLGAFIAGVLLAETNYRDRIEADIQPFRGLLLGLFFVTTGAAVDPGLVVDEFPTACALLFGLLTIKTAVVFSFGTVAFDLDRKDAIRAALLLAGGGEFAFVVLTLASRLDVLPATLARLDTAIVVLSMALTPVLGALGDSIAEGWDADERKALAAASVVAGAAADDDASSLVAANQPPLDIDDGPVVAIRGFGRDSKTVAAVLAEARASPGLSYVAFDEHVPTVAEARARGFPVAYGSVTPSLVESLVAGGGANLAAVLVPSASEAEVRKLRRDFPRTPILASSPSPALDPDDAPPAAKADDEADAEKLRYALADAGADVVVAADYEPQIRVAAAYLEQHTDVSDEAIRSAVAHVRTRIERNSEKLRKVAGVARTTVSGGGFDLDADAARGVVAGARARAARDLDIFASPDDDDDDDDGDGDGASP